MFGPVSSKYFHYVQEGALQEDPEQIHCLQALDDLHDALHRSLFTRHFYKNITGAYIFGDVGRGKTYLMDLFFSTVKKNKQRWHYHIFLSHLHNNLIHHSVTPWEDLAASVYRQGRLLCLDEFQIMDMGDLMILSRFFKVFFYLGGVLITTSNRLPNEFNLYNQNYLKRFYDFFSEHMNYIQLNKGPDFRQKGLIKPRIVLEKPTTQQHHASYHDSFQKLFESPRGVAHYIDILNKYDGVIVSQFKQMNDENEDSLMRFIQLIDLLYETKTSLSIQTDLPVDSLYTGNKHRHLFQRTISRLIEISSR